MPKSEERLLNSVEALGWLRENRNEHGFAGNRFGVIKEAIAFVQGLYDAGALLVGIPFDRISAEEWRLKEDNGPRADTLLVRLPDDPVKSRAIWKICEKEYEDEYGSEWEPTPPDYTPTGVVDLWWD